MGEYRNSACGKDSFYGFLWFQIFVGTFVVIYIISYSDILIRGIAIAGHQVADMGLEGVEAFYSGFSENLSAEMLSLASQYGLYVTAGSDYHGANKPICLGQTGFSSETELPEGLAAFMDRIS